MRKKSANGYKFNHKLGIFRKSIKIVLALFKYLPPDAATHSNSNPVYRHWLFQERFVFLSGERAACHEQRTRRRRSLLNEFQDMVLGFTTPKRFQILVLNPSLFFEDDEVTAPPLSRSLPDKNWVDWAPFRGRWWLPSCFACYSWIKKQQFFLKLAFKPEGKIGFSPLQWGFLVYILKNNQKKVTLVPSN